MGLAGPQCLAVRPVGPCGRLNPDNVERALSTSGAWGVDVSSGIEAERGVKDPGLMRAFAQAVRRNAPE